MQITTNLTHHEDECVLLLPRDMPMVEIARMLATAGLSVRMASWTPLLLKAEKCDTQTHFQTVARTRVEGVR